MIHRYLTVFSAFLLTIGMAAPTWAQSTAKAKSAPPQAKSNPTNEVQKADEAKGDEEKSTDPKTKADVPTEEKKAQAPKPPKIERATFGGGCHIHFAVIHQIQDQNGAYRVQFG